MILCGKRKRMEILYIQNSLENRTIKNRFLDSESNLNYFNNNNNNLLLLLMLFIQQITSYKNRHLL